MSTITISGHQNQPRIRVVQQPQPREDIGATQGGGAMVADHGTERSWSRSAPKLSALAGMSRSNWPKSPYSGTGFGKSCGGSMNCDEDLFRHRQRGSTARRKRHERRVRMARKMTEWPSRRGPITKIMLSNGCKGDTVPLAMGKWYDFHEFGWHLGNVGFDESSGN